MGNEFALFVSGSLSVAYMLGPPPIPSIHHYMLENQLTAVKINTPLDTTHSRGYFLIKYLLLQPLSLNLPEHLVCRTINNDNDCEPRVKGQAVAPVHSGLLRLLLVEKLIFQSLYNKFLPVL